MARFTVRVVLHDNATWEEYSDLRARLADIGVCDSIQSTEGAWYRLPPAEYNYEGDIDAHVLRAAVSNIATTVKPRHEVLVTDAINRYWVGLEEIAEADR